MYLHWKFLTSKSKCQILQFLNNRDLVFYDCSQRWGLLTTCLQVHPNLTVSIGLGLFPSTRGRDTTAHKMHSRSPLGPLQGRFLHRWNENVGFAFCWAKERMFFWSKGQHVERNKCQSGCSAAALQLPQPRAGCSTCLGGRWQQSRPRPYLWLSWSPAYRTAHLPGAEQGVLALLWRWGKPLGVLPTPCSLAVIRENQGPSHPRRSGRTRGAFGAAARSGLGMHSPG